MTEMMLLIDPDKEIPEAVPEHLFGCPEISTLIN